MMTVRGAIACALGKAGNRRAFKERFAFMPVDEEARPTWSGHERPQTIWQWLKSYEGPTFTEAAQRFRAADDAVSESIRRFVRYADLHREVGLVPLEEYCRELRERTEAAADDHRRAREKRDAAFAEVTALKERLSHLQEEEHLLDRSAPGWWQSVLPTAAGREHRNSRAANLEQQLSLGRLREAERRLAEQQARAKKAGRQYEDSRQRLSMHGEAWSEKRDEFENLAMALGHRAVPLRLEELESVRFQIDGLWHSDELARLRTDLFEAALALHEAWLADVGSKGGGFGGNIVATVKLLSGNEPLKRDHLPTIWQSLFMIVAVVSTTFASFARQFGGLGPGSIGWLFVDEAGQAVPQAAVGALLRSKRAMMIGDPLQIEPVFSLPSALIGALAALSPHTSEWHHAPNRVSAQILADAGNRFGTTVPADGGDGLWIGSPLRVHRRCIEPMFSLANRIAYRNKMVFAAGAGPADEEAAPFRNDSSWIDIKGRVSGKQTVVGQVDFIVDVLVTLYRRDGILPASYIISPFKETKNALKQALLQARWSDADRYSSPPKLHRWLQDRIGTVHTFQGKEESAVFMVLGTDADHVGAAIWASSKPNLLNVAATRARRRFYIVADRDLWQGMPHFREAAKALQTVRAAEFLARL
ncbi:Superfamily I DNA/RNA helicase protein [Sinorhizobium alkalisoli]|nr:Superfamily I DNA/RNA helicase protein [Sinorhizobium alkalisoli]